MIYSRRFTLEERKNKRKAFYLFITTILFIILLIYYGIPTLVKFLAFLSEFKISSQPLEIHDTTPPFPPTFEDIPSFTNKDKLEVKGHTEAGAIVRLLFNSSTEEIVADSNGLFSYKFSLKEGENQLSAIAVDSSGNESQSSKKEIIVYDKVPPKLEIINPHDNQNFFGEREKQIIIEGQTEKDTKVRINSKWVVVNNEGKFFYTYTLDTGRNSFEITAEDLAGNINRLDLILHYAP